ncbi:hypothetical protein HZB88_02230 [archaeon]|nr:hypothetical protein [archaeon]
MHKYILSDSAYYEGIIQLRPYREEAFLFIKNQAEKYNVYISKVEEHKTGIDVYLSSQKFVRNTAQKLKKQFNAKMTISKSIVTRDRMKSRDLYRATALIRFR